MTNNRIKCELCGLDCSMQISASHLRVKHSMTTKEYRALGFLTLSPARLHQLRQSPVGNGKQDGVRHNYGPAHHNWKGGYVGRNGYRYLSVRGIEVLEHRHIASQMLGRPLGSDEVVHHIDGNRINNSPDNLAVMKRGDHDKLKDGIRAYHHTGPDCEEAARILLGLRWPKSKIERALRIHHSTLVRWLSVSDAASS